MLLSSVAAAMVRYRSGGAGGAVFGVIFLGVIVIALIAWVVGPKKASKVDPRTGFERQTLPTSDGPTKKYAMWGVAGFLALLGLYLVGNAYGETERTYGAPMGAFGTASFAAAMIVFFLAGGFERLACAIGAGFGLVVALKPALFGYHSSYGNYTYAYTASDHMGGWVAPGFLLMFVAGLFFIRYLRQR